MKTATKQQQKYSKVVPVLLLTHGFLNTYAGVDLLLHDNRWRESSATRGGRLTFGVRPPQNPLDGKLGGPKWRSERCEVDKNLCRNSNRDRPVRTPSLYDCAASARKQQYIWRWTCKKVPRSKQFCFTPASSSSRANTQITCHTCRECTYMTREPPPPPPTHTHTRTLHLPLWVTIWEINSRVQRP
jgi:hypothetical protein